GCQGRMQAGLIVVIACSSPSLRHRADHVRTELPRWAGCTRWWRSVELHAQQSPHATIEVERLERAIKIITLHTEATTRAAFWQEIEVSTWSNARLRTYPIRKWI